MQNIRCQQLAVFKVVPEKESLYIIRNLLKLEMCTRTVIHVLKKSLKEFYLLCETNEALGVTSPMRPLVSRQCDLSSRS